MNLQEFATDAYPLHPSGLRNLLMCPWREVMSLMLSGEDEAGPAADTGSAMHRAAQALHKGSSAADALGVMQAEVANYPRADLQDAAALFLAYATDPRTKEEVVLCETQISFELAPSPQDPTGAPISVVGTVDQVRRVDGRLQMWDIKTSKKDPVTVLRDSMHQAAAYCVGASFLLQEEVHPGGLIMPRKRPMYIPFAWRFSDIEDILAPLRDTVALVRSGVLHHVPSSHMCEWCPGQMPELCLPRKRRFLRELA